MKEPITLRRADGSQKVTVDGLRTFIKEVYLDDHNTSVHNENYLKDRVDGIEKSIRAIAKWGNKQDLRNSVAIWGVIAVGLLAKRRFSKQEKKIKDLNTEIEGLKDDTNILYAKVEQMEAELFEMEDRLHAVASKDEDILKEDDSKEE